MIASWNNGILIKSSYLNSDVRGCLKEVLNLKAMGTIVLWCSGMFQEGPELWLHDAERRSHSLEQLWLSNSSLKCVHTRRVGNDISRILSSVKRSHKLTEKYFLNLVKSTRNQIVFAIFRLIWNTNRLPSVFQINRKW